jgi:formylglycine-generating enzyme required for sulfatase activity
MKYLKAISIAAFAVSLLFLIACGGGDDKKKEVKLTLTPGTKTVLTGQPAIFTVATTNTDFSVSTDKAAAGCVKTNATTVTCTPTAAGVYELTVTATADSKVTEKATITVNEVSIGLSLTSATVEIGQPAIVTVTVTPAGTDFSISTDKAAAGCVKTNATTVTCTPTAADTYTLTITAADKTKDVTITAVEPDEVIIGLSSIPETVVIGQPVTITVTVTPEGTDFNISTDKAAAGCVKTNATTVTCTPTAADTYTLTITAADKTKDVTITAVEPTPEEIEGMAYVTAGTFLMGCTEEQYSAYMLSGCSMEARPQHTVNLTQDFYIGRTEVTQSQWKELMGVDNNPSTDKSDDEMPVTNVSWTDVQGFLAKLNTQNAILGWKWDLPTEAQWEFAAIGGTGSKGYAWSGGNDVKSVAWWGNASGNSQGVMHLVKTRVPNELGLYDMSGNVGEWVKDFYSNVYYGIPDAAIDPQGPETDSLNLGLNARGARRGLPKYHE